MKRKKNPQLHTDGTVCYEGTRRVPRPFKACCVEFNKHTLACVHDVRYEWWPKQKTWVIPIGELSGGGGVAISHCPHCGKKLKGSGKIGRWIEV